MTAKAIAKNVPVLSGAFDANNSNSTAPSAGQMAVGFLPNVDNVNAEEQNYLHGAHTAYLYSAQQMGLILPFNPDGTGKSLIACPKGGIVSLTDSVSGDTQFYVAQVAMTAGFIDPSLDPTNWTQINFEVLAKLVPAYADATGTVDAVLANYSVAYPVLQDGLRLSVGTIGPNTIAQPTFKPTLNGSAQNAWVIAKFHNGALVDLLPGDMQGTAVLVADVPNTKWILMNPMSAATNTTSDPTTVDAGDSPVSAGWVRAAIAKLAPGGTQTLQDVTALRALNTTYTNNTGRLIFALITINGSSSGQMKFYINGNLFLIHFVPNGVQTYICVPIPYGDTYEAIPTGADTIFSWWELR